MKFKSPLPKIAYHRNAEIYRIMANPLRLEILNSLAVCELSVEQLTELLGVRKANVSQHLAVLRQAGLVAFRREGQSVFYTITDRRIVDPCTILYNMWSKPARRVPMHQAVASKASSRAQR